MYDTNRDGLVDTPEYARGELNTEHRCKLYNVDDMYIFIWLHCRWILSIDHSMQSRTKKTSSIHFVFLF